MTLIAACVDHYRFSLQTRATQQLCKHTYQADKQEEQYTEGGGPIVANVRMNKVDLMYASRRERVLATGSARAQEGLHC